MAVRTMENYKIIAMRVMRVQSTLITLIAVLSSLLSACGGRTEGIYLPPTRASNAQPPAAVILTSTPTETTPLAALPTPTPPCADSLRYIEDQTIPDGSLVNPSEALDKRWLVENSGTCNWDQGYRLKLVAGPELGAVAEQGLYPARSGTQATIRIDFTAPPEPGAYRSAWQAFSPGGQPFGDPVFIDIQVGP